MAKPDEVVKGLESYITSHPIDKVVKQLAISVLAEKPDSVELHMLRDLIRHPNVQDAQLPVAVASSADCRVVVQCDDGEAQSYFARAGVPQLFARLLGEVRHASGRGRDGAPLRH
jgi:hypothetical protein